MIVAENLSKNYGTYEAVKDVNFTIRSGDIVGLLGPNGAGKTTIIKVLTCYHLPTAGKAVLNAFDVAETPECIKKIIGYLPENAPLYPDLTVQEYLQFIAGSRGVPGKKRNSVIDKVVEECDLSEVFYKPIEHLSKGFRQRVGLSQAIMHDPEILILDEPTNGLDPNQIIEIRDLIRRIGREKTVILSTHILQEVEAVCNRVLILHRGRLVADDTVENMETSLNGETVFKLVLKSGSREAVLASLKNIPAVKKIMRFETAGRNRYEAVLSFRPDPDTAEAVFDWAVSENHKILSMAQEHLSLEDIFVELTRDGGKHE